jgi:hypothetical protein
LPFLRRKIYANEKVARQGVRQCVAANGGESSVSCVARQAPPMYYGFRRSAAFRCPDSKEIHDWQAEIVFLFDRDVVR